jgi:hypothetical protein
VPLTNQIRIATTGQIIAGKYTGWFVRVEDDTENTNGYLILISKSPQMTSCFDDWVVDMTSVASVFSERAWSVDWSE